MSFTGKPSLTTADPVTNDGFWPDVSLADLLNNYRIPAEYADGVIETGLVIALLRVNETLEPVKQAVIDLGYTRLSDYLSANSEQVNGVEVLISQYNHAVYTRAKAGLLQQFNSLNRKPIAENAAKESDDTEQYWLDESQASIRSFFNHFLPTENTLGKSGAHVVLL